MKRRGLTLVELLVVVTVIVVLLAAAAPMFRAGLEERKLVEATRGLGGIIAKAKAMASESGRPVGIALERLDTSDPVNNPFQAMQSMQVYVVEVPVPYAGDMDDATCVLRDMNFGVGLDGQWGIAGVDDDSNGTVDDISERGAPNSDDGDGMPETMSFNDVLGSEGARVLINIGDQIRFNFRGPFYQVIAKNNISATETDIVISHPETVWGNGANGVFNGGVYGSDDVWISPPAPQAAGSEARFQVYRGPIRTLAQPFQMPSGMTIDLSVSGLGPNGGEFGALTAGVFDHPIVIMFNPTGEVAGTYVGGAAFRVQQPIHLLVGRTDLVSPPTPGNVAATLINVINFEDDNANGQRESTEKVLSNLMLGDESRWVSIGHRNGLVTVSTNDTITLNSALTDPLKVSDAIGQGRFSAVESQTYGGGR